MIKCVYQIYTVYQLYQPVGYINDIKLLIIYSKYLTGGDFLNIRISYDSEKPMYEQIEEQIKEAICNNQAMDNEPLPSVRQLSSQLNVSAITIKRAYADLEKEGFIYTMAGKGTFVKLKHIDSIKGRYVEEQLNELKDKLSKMKKSGVSKEDIVSVIDEIFSEKERQ